MERLLGNERLMQGLRSAIGREKLSHSYLICGPEGSGKHTLARFLAAAMQCQAAPERRPCGQCLACRKVLDDVHPDLITVDEPARKIVGVELIRRAREDVYIRPNEGRRKIYLFPRAGDMNPSAQNALLKIIEEPPPYGAFLLLSENAERLLPTIRSRCVSLQMSPLDESEGLPALRRAFPKASEEALHAAWQRAGGFLGQAKTLLAKEDGLDPRTLRFAAAFAAHDRLALTELLVGMEKLKRDQLAPLLLEWEGLLCEAMRIRAGLPGAEQAAAVARVRTPGELLQIVRLLQRSGELLAGNVSPGAVCGVLCVELTAENG